MNTINIFNVTIHPYLYVPVFYLLWVSIFLLLKRIIFTRISRLAEKTSIKVDDIFLTSLDKPLLILIFISGAYAVRNIAGFGMDSDILRTVDGLFKAAGIVAAVMFFDSLFNALVLTYIVKVRILKGAGNVVRIVLRSVVIGLGLLVLLDSFGVSIAPLLASLGIGSLAVALALQPTLENLFSGIQIVVDKPVAVGQFIKLETGEEGYVHRVGWRSTWVRMLPNNMVVVPNKVLANSKIINYYYPETEMAVLVQVGVHYDSDLEHVEKITIETAKEVLENVQGGVAEFDPFIRYHTFNDFSIDFTVILRAKEFVDNYLVKHEFIKRLHKRYNEEGIVIPYPIRTLDWNPGSGPLKIEKGTS